LDTLGAGLIERLDYVRLEAGSIEGVDSVRLRWTPLTCCPNGNPTSKH